ncbi:hypothetical protein HOH67_01195 [Candidatus Peregrinibacteria bacterium]|jgi:SAM-dependent methyltransferase|nr:hypothetical protein [Candidatus Peregrinibacteria bacterium]
MINSTLATILNFSIIEFILVVVIIGPTIYVMVTSAPFVPSQMKQVDRMLKAANLKKGAKVYDLGAGDGRFLHKAANEYKANAVGYEYSPLVWLWSKFLSIFWRSSAKLRFGNFWKQDFSDADLIVVYLLPNTMIKLKKEIWPNLKPGTLLISHSFSIKDFKPWKKLPKNRAKKLGPVWIYKKTTKN